MIELNAETLAQIAAIITSLATLVWAFRRKR